MKNLFVGLLSIILAFCLITSSVAQESFGITEITVLNGGKTLATEVYQIDINGEKVPEEIPDIFSFLVPSSLYGKLSYFCGIFAPDISGDDEEFLNSELSIIYDLNDYSSAHYTIMDNFDVNGQFIGLYFNLYENPDTSYRKYTQLGFNYGSDPLHFIIIEGSYSLKSLLFDGYYKYYFNDVDLTDIYNNGTFNWELNLSKQVIWQDTPMNIGIKYERRIDNDWYGLFARLNM